MFKDEVRKLIREEANGTLYCNLTDEQRKAIATIQTAANTETQTMASAATVRAVDIAAAIEARATRADSQDRIGVYADEIHMKDHSRKEHVYQCTVAKSTNIVTSEIIEASVLKLYSVARMTHSDKGAAARNYIRTDWQTDLLKPAQSVSTERLIKNTSMADTTLSATVFPADIQLKEEITAAIDAGINLKALMISEFLASLKGQDKSVILTAYRNCNRSMLDQIFDSQYAIYIGRVNDSDPSAVQEYIEALKDYREGLGSIGSMFLSSDTADFGLNIRKLSISPTVQWSNRQKMSRLRRFGTGSYYVSSNEDTGIGRIPTSPEILSEHMDDITALIDHCMAIVENEARLENGYREIDTPKLPDIKQFPDNTGYAGLLGISSEVEREIIAELESKATELAAAVCQRRKAAANNESVEMIQAMMGR